MAVTSLKELKETAVLPRAAPEAAHAVRGATNVIVAANVASFDTDLNLGRAADTSVVIVLSELLVDVAPAKRRAVWSSAVADVIHAIHDIDSIALLDIGITAAQLLALADQSPRLKWLALPNCGIDAEGARAIAENLSGLTLLDLRDNQIGAEGARAIARHLTGLSTLELGHNQIGDEGARAIAENLSVITTLELGHNQIGDEGARAIAENLSGLTTLNLVGNGVESEGARAIAEHLSGLTTLKLGDDHIGGEGARAIAEHLRGLTTLDLWDNGVGEVGARAIARHLSGLTTLDLGLNGVGDEGARAIAEHLPGLTNLRLGANGVGDAGARAIAEHLPGLTTLDLGLDGVGDEGARAIAEHLRGLTTLDLWHNGVGEVGARAIAEHLGGLTTLSLGLNGVGEAGARAIAEHLPGLTKLYLGSNGVGGEGARAIARHLTGLSTLNLGFNGVGDEGARAIAEHLGGLTTLILAGNGVGDAGARAIAEHLGGLTTLDLGGNGVGDAGARAIAQGLPGLTKLYLGGNGVGDAGARAIAQGLPGLTTLELGHNQVGDGLGETLSVLASHAPSRLRNLGVRGNPGLEGIGIPELLKSGDAGAILSAWRRMFDGSPKVPFGEAKLVVLGHEAVGKTSLVNALVHGRPCDPNEPKTPGVNHEIWVTPWVAEIADSGAPTTQLNVWDFGGQEILHQTHRYFLSERCVYLIVLENRREDDKSVYEWLNTVEARSPNSPIIIAVNKCESGGRFVDANSLDVSFATLLKDREQIVAVLNVTCTKDVGWTGSPQEPNASIGPLRTRIGEVLRNDDRLDTIRTPVPAAYVRVREAIRQLARSDQVLSSQAYLNICTGPPEPNLRVSDPDEQRALLRLLHETGVVVAHGLNDQTRSLDGLTLLQPNWLTDAIYALLASRELIERNGVFDKQTLSGLLQKQPLWQGRYGDDRLEYIIDMMRNPDFALCFRLPGDEAHPTYLMPEGLKPDPPSTIAGWDPNSLQFQYRYKVLPRGLVPQFMVHAHTHSGPNPDRWRSGCTLDIHGCGVLVSGDAEQSTVDILITGPGNRRDALAVVRDLFSIVHKRMPETHPEERVPLPDNPKVSVLYQHLELLFSSEGGDYVFYPEGVSKGSRVGDLLGAVRDISHPERPPKQPGGGNKTHVTVTGKGNRVLVGGGGAEANIETAPEPPADPGGNRRSRLADLIAIGTPIGVMVGLIVVAIYLYGKGKGYPIGDFVRGAGAGAVFGPMVMFLYGLVRHDR